MLANDPKILNMKTIGIVGGTSWFSSVDYYRYINEMVNLALGGDEAARLILFSVNYGEIKKLTQADDWQGVRQIIAGAAQNLERAGADVVILGANTMHYIFDQVEASIGIPMIHIADAVAKEIQKQSLKKVALLGTKYTMQLPFFAERLERFNIETIIPSEHDVEVINRSIYEELGKGIFTPETRKVYQSIITKLKNEGAEGVILGCTEIPMLIKLTDSELPVFDTTLIHSKAAVDFALN